MRNDENWAWLRTEPAASDVWDPIKYVRLSPSRDDWFLTFGGEAREWVEAYHNELWGSTGHPSNAYLLQRYMLHIDAHATRYVRLFAQLKSGIETGRKGGPRPIDRDTLDFNQLFVDLVAVPGASTHAEPQLLARIGRQEMHYGSGRLIDVREGPNVRFGYDGVRIMAHLSPLRVDAFAVRPQLTKPDVFDDATDPHQAFWGVWSTLDLPFLTSDAYYLGLERDQAKYERAQGAEHRQTVGARVRGMFHVAEVEVEGAYQFGSMAGLPIAAFTFASEAVIRGANLPLKPVATLGFGVTSGDAGPSSKTFGTFNPLFPRGAYFGLISANGPSNEMAPHAALTVAPTRQVDVSAEFWAFARENSNDGVYSVPGMLLRSGHANQSRYLGSQLEVFANWHADRHLTLSATVARFATGAFFRTSLPGKDIDYGAAWATYKF